MTSGSRNLLPKRFYDTVCVQTGDGGFNVTLDGKPVRTPARAGLCVKSEALAGEIAREWQAQGEKIDPAAMPMTRRANTALDRVKGREEAVADEIVTYAGSDLVCYRAGSPQKLVEMQAQHWDPVLAWAREKLGARFAVQAGVSHVPQPEASLAAVRAHLGAHDCFTLTPLHTMTTLTGSALLALAHEYGKLEADAMWDAAHVDEDWQISQWGEDAEAAARRAARRAELDEDVRFLALVRAERDP